MGENESPPGFSRVDGEFEYAFPVQDDVPAEVCNVISINQDGNLVYLTFGLAVPALLSSQEQATELAQAGPLPARVVARVVMTPQTFTGLLRAALDQNQVLTERLVTQSRDIIRQVEEQAALERGEATR